MVKYYWEITEENIIYDENNKRINTAKRELAEQKLANHFIKENDCVLELGARYGSVSVVINKKLKDKTKQLSVEPDERVWDALEKNKKINNCQFNILKGFLSNKKLNLINKDVYAGGYAATYIEDNNSNIINKELNDFSDYNFNVLVADCEGYLEEFFNQNKDFINNLRLIIFESDYASKCNYKKIRKDLENNGFKKILSGSQNVYLK
tara:strand:- start:848 stop:1471 length:624 start_codon:yes stop_codon:yes gene_type:complete